MTSPAVPGRSGPLRSYFRGQKAGGEESICTLGNLVGGT